MSIFLKISINGVWNMKFIKGFLINLQFFTAIPIKLELPMDKEHLRKAVQTFPLLGLFQGIIYAYILFFLLEWTPFSHQTVAFILWLTTILITGGIHLDGWMDASDAYFSYQDKQKRLEIMKDPRMGAFGVISVIILLSCRFLFFYDITEKVNFLSYILIATVPILSKSVMGMMLLTVKTAKNEGLGRMFQAAANPKVLWIYPVYIIAYLYIAFLLGIGFISIGILFLAALVSYLICRRNARKWFGGITGDVLGASVEGTELLLWMTVWLLHYFVMG
jgi:adenosylcobinamide-GDP ribazoletransferase